VQSGRNPDQKGIRTQTYNHITKEGKEVRPEPRSEGD